MAGALGDGEIIDGKYRIVRFLGRGAWSSVYEGVNTRIGRRVAIKVMSGEAVQKPGIVERFEREAQAATRIDSEHVVHVFDLGVLADGRPYIVMELLEGHNLAQVIAKSGTLSERRAVFYVVQALRGLAEAHAAGVIHRDIKPENIVLVRTKQGDEVVKIVDFGISKLHAGANVTSMTQTNTVLGSPAYMSPEQCRGMRLMDHRSDIYSLGVVLFELLTGRVPHSGETFNELMFRIALEDAAKPTEFRPDLDPDLCAITMKALARDVEARYQTAEELERALVEWGHSHGLDDERGSHRTRLRIQVDDGASASFRATTERPPAPTSGAARTLQSATAPPSAEPKAEEPSPDAPPVEPLVAPRVEPLVDPRTETGDRAMSVSTPVRASDVPAIPRRRPRVLAAALFGSLAAVGIVLLIVGLRRMADANATPGTASAASSTTPAAPPVDAEPTVKDAIATAEPASDPPVVAVVASITPVASTAGTPAASARGSRRPTPTAPSPPAVASAVPVTVPAPAAGHADAGPVVDGRRIRTDF